MDVKAKLCVYLRDRIDCFAFPMWKRIYFVAYRKHPLQNTRFIIRTLVKFLVESFEKVFPKHKMIAIIKKHIL